MSIKNPNPQSNLRMRTPRDLGADLARVTQERDEARAECESISASRRLEAIHMAGLTAECERLRAENAALAAWQCIHTDGKTGLTHTDGNAWCAKDPELRVLRAFVRGGK